MELFLGLVFGIIAGLISTTGVNYLKNKNELNLLKKIDKSKEKFIQKTKDKSYFTIGPLNIRISTWLTIEKKKQNGWNYKEIKFDTDLKEYFNTIPKNLYSFIEKSWKYEAEIGSKIFNGLRYGLYELKINDNLNSDKIHFTFKSTNYKHFMGTNVLYNRWATELKNKYFDDRIFRNDGYKYLNTSCLSNDLGTATTIITRDDKVILSKRSNDVKILPNDIHTSIAEGMSPDEDKLNVFHTIIRGAREELGIEINETEIEILGLGLYFDYAQPFVLGLVKSEMTFDELKKDSKNNFSTMEGDCVDVPFNPCELAPFLFDNYFPNIRTAETAKISLILCLIQKYGKNTLEKELYKINSVLAQRAEAIIPSISTSGNN